MKSCKHIFSIIFLLIFICSCKKDFLEVDDNSFINRQSYVHDLKTMGEFLDGNYIMLHQSFFHGLNLIYPEIIADNVKPYVGAGMLVPHYNWAQKADLQAEDAPSQVSLAMNASWIYGYRIIRACSFVIDNIDKYRGENPEKADDIKGQAYALRALTHFQLVNIFAQPYNFTADASHAGIPYITTPNITEAEIRNNVADVYTGLINDLNVALPLFKASTNALYMNRNAAKALLARVFLFKGDYQSSKNLAREVSIAVPIMINTITRKMYPDSLFRKGESEALYQLPPVGLGVSNGTYNTFFPGRWFTGARQSFWGTNDIASILKENPQDLRNTWITNSSGNWLITKYPVNVIPGYTNTSGSYYQTILRSSEMYLTAAESYAKINNEDSARYYLDEIRKRANPLAISTIATGPALLDSIYKERRKELSFEGLRMFDLLRWKKGVNRTDAPNQATQTLPYPSNKAIAPLPVPDVNLSGLTQNMDY